MAKFRWLFVLAACCWVSCCYAGDKKTRILLIGKDKDHARASHEYMADCGILAKCLRQTPGVEAIVSNGWPKDPEALRDIQGIVLNTRLGGNVAFDPLHRKQFEDLAKSGVGVTAIHWATGADVKFGQDWLHTMGGWFNADNFSKYSVKTTMLEQLDPKHPVCRGWKDYKLREEYYYQLLFLYEAKPILKARFDDRDHVVGWVYERPNSKNGRSFGCVLGHFHDNYAEPAFRRLLVNGILWSAHLDVPEQGAAVDIVTKDLELPPDPQKAKTTK